jgi:zinc/manganese transport system substrate-binding protein
VLSQVAGDNFDVVALIEDPAMDPHSYEASARDQLAVSEASMFVMNGGGYDDFALVLAAAAGIEAFNIYEIHEAAHAHEDDHAHSEDHAHEDEHAHEEEDHAHEDEHAHEDGHSQEGHDHDHAHDGSDHIWYDFHVAKHMASLFAEEMAKLQPENADQFSANAEAFRAAMTTIETRRDALADSSIHYFEAHPMASLLFGDLGFENLTPEGFAEAEEAELEPPVAVLAQAQEVIRSGKRSFIAVNSQVTSPTLEGLKELADEYGVAVLEFEELLPTGMSYQQWASSVLEKIESIN